VQSHENLECGVEISTLYVIQFQRYNYFRLWRLYRYFRLSSRLQSLVVTISELYMVINPRFSVGIAMLSVTVSEICFRFRRPFPVVGHYCNRPGTLSSSSPWSKTLGLPLDFLWHLSYFRRYKYFMFWRTFWYFRLSVVVEVTVFDIAVVDSPKFAVDKKRIWRLSK